MLGASASCFAPNCTQQIRGHCPGFKGSCGRFYCAQHSKGQLCAVCAERHAEYNALLDTLSDYTRTAASLPQNPGVAAGLEAVGIWALIALVGSVMGPYSAIIAVLAGIVIAVVFWPRRTAQRTKDINQMVIEVEKVKPHFGEFYKLWIAENSPSSEAIISGVVGSGIGLAVGAVSIVHADLQRHNAEMNAWTAWYRRQRAYDDLHAIRKSLE